MDAGDNEIEMLDPEGNVVLSAKGDKDEVAKQILQVIQRRLVEVFSRAGKE